MTAWNEIERRRLWDHSVAAKATTGQFIEADARFLEWIEDWISGAIPMSEVQRRYRNLLVSRRKE